jgi:hypothetical protein
MDTNGHEIFLPRPVRHSLGDGGMNTDLGQKEFLQKETKETKNSPVLQDS